MSAVLYGVLAAFFNGLLVGSLYGLMALGLTLIYRVTKIPNFAFAEYITYGAYAAVAASFVIDPVNSAALLVAGILFATSAGAVIALASDELVFKPLWRRGSEVLQLLVASIGVGLVLRYSLLGAAALTGGKYLEVRFPVTYQTVFSVGGLASITTAHLLAITSMVLFAIVLHLLFTRTRLGKAMRATASNPTLAQITGINVILVRRITWLMAGALASFAGFTYSYYNPVNPESGWITLLWIFSAAIMGGFTFYGVLLSGLLLGIAENVVGFLANYYLGIGSEYNPVIALVTLVTVLMVRPEGLIRMESLVVARRV
ncbi:MAG: branched-chain amino acid ABC transporter permease [Desulfurococcales archaeon]|nr:branched-chain amino acid ABC transporter permease [Desulfurococcales archaeon]